MTDTRRAEFLRKLDLFGSASHAIAVASELKDEGAVGRAMANRDILRDDVLADFDAATAVQGGEPVAWMWEYIGADAYARYANPGGIARTMVELDPANNPYPEAWRPLYPLYAAAPPVQVKGEAVAYLYADDMAELERVGSARIYQQRQNFTILPHQEPAMAVYLSPPAARQDEGREE